MVNEGARLQTAMRLQISGQLAEAKKMYLDLLKDNL
jgi:hypothetical protein